MARHGRPPAALPALAALGVLALLWPTDAYAWGPLAHLQFSSGALEGLSAVGPAVRALLTRFPAEFLYGSLAADIVVGKNLARYAVHCHNWAVGFQVLERAKGDPQKAFSLGFLSHLAVDTVAHNYYVPYKTVQAFRRRHSGHAYWELRYDQQLPTDLWRLARRVSQAEYRAHDDHLKEVLSESHVLPFTLSRTMFGSLLLAAKLKRWQQMSAVVAGERDLSLHREEVQECHKLAVRQILGMLRDQTAAECTRADPTGTRNLHLASELRTRLRTRPDLDDGRAEELALKSRAAFRHAIDGPVRLPELPDAPD